MKNRILLIAFVLTLVLLPIAKADIPMPTLTKVYFEQAGQPYNAEIEFTINAYGYNTGIPGALDYNPDRAAGTYTPEVVYSFSAKYEKYGDSIHEDFYMNYMHIDYYELEGKTADGKTFILKNIPSIFSNCSYVGPSNINRDSEDNYSKKCELRFNLDDAEWLSTPQKISFWQKLKDFFNKLFGLD